jgi:hypothetical protein
MYIPVGTPNLSLQFRSYRTELTHKVGSQNPVWQTESLVVLQPSLKRGPGLDALAMVSDPAWVCPNSSSRVVIRETGFPKRTNM